MSLETLTEEIRKDALEEYNNIINNAKIDAENNISIKKNELIEYYDKAKKEIDIELKKYKLKLFAKIELDTFRAYQVKETEYIKHILSSLFNDFVDKIKTDEKKYLSYLIGSISNSIRLLDSNELKISLNKNDEKYINEIKKMFTQKIELLPSSHILGGVIIISKNNYIDYSLEKIFEESKEEIVKILNE